MGGGGLIIDERRTDRSVCAGGGWMLPRTARTSFLVRYAGREILRLRRALAGLRWENSGAQLRSGGQVRAKAAGEEERSFRAGILIGCLQDDRVRQLAK